MGLLRLAAKDPAKACGALAVGKQWCWYETWLNRVREDSAGCMIAPPRSISTSKSVRLLRRTRTGVIAEQTQCRSPAGRFRH